MFTPECDERSCADAVRADSRACDYLPSPNGPSHPPARYLLPGEFHSSGTGSAKPRLNGRPESGPMDLSHIYATPVAAGYAWLPGN